MDGNSTTEKQTIIILWEKVSHVVWEKMLSHEMVGMRKTGKARGMVWGNRNI